MEELWYLEYARQCGFRAGCLSEAPPSRPLIIPSVDPKMGFTPLWARHLLERVLEGWSLHTKKVQDFVKEKEEEKLRKLFQKWRETSQRRARRAGPWRLKVAAAAAAALWFITRKR